MIIEQVPVTRMAVFCYICIDESSRNAVLIDPAGDHEKIASRIKDSRAEIVSVINTHGHFDHTSGNDYWISKTGAPLMIHEKDAPKLRKMSNRVLSRAMGGKSSPAPVTLLKQNDEIPFGKSSLRVIHTPGHSAGSICLYTKGHIFTGDTLFTEGMGRTDLGDGSYKEIMRSITEKILILPEDTIIWPGHNYGRFPRSTVKEQKRIYLR